MQINICKNIEFLLYIYLGSSPVYDQYEQIRQAERERAEIVGRYDKVNK